MSKSFTVRDLPVEDRPRERLIQQGVGALSPIELLAVIMGSGSKNESVMNVAQRLINKFHNFRNMTQASIEELSQIRGIGLAKACQIKAALEMGRKADKDTESKPKITIKNPEDVEKFIKPQLKDKKKEHFIALLLDSRSHLIKPETISVGSLNASIVHPREAFKLAIAASAASVIFVHNHPSGDPEPSKDDIKLTKRLMETGEIVGIDVLDHIIIGQRKCVSMKEQKFI